MPLCVSHTTRIARCVCGEDVKMWIKLMWFDVLSWDVVERDCAAFYLLSLRLCWWAHWWVWENVKDYLVLKHEPRSRSSMRVLRCVKPWGVAKASVLTWTVCRNCKYGRNKHDAADPKEGDLYLTRMKPLETGVEVRTRSDVQIDVQSWVKGRKTNRTF